MIDFCQMNQSGTNIQLEMTIKGKYQSTIWMIEYKFGLPS
jgi:hypothetical protein